MSRIRNIAAAKRVGAGMMAAFLVAGTSLPAVAAGQGVDQGADPKGAQNGDMSVQEAWTNAKEDWRELQEASGDAWGEARTEFQKSWSRLQRLMSEQDGAAPPPDDPAALEQGDGVE